MFCPKCGSSRKTTGQRFCTRCGLNLALPRLQPLQVRHSAPTLRLPETPCALGTKSLAALGGITQPLAMVRRTVPEPQALVKTTARRIGSKRSTTLIWLCLVAVPIALAFGFKPSTLSGHAQNLPAEASTPTIQPASTPPAIAEPSPSVTPVPESVNWSVIADETRLTFQAEKVLSATDGEAAEIAPGGQLALAFTAGQSFHNGPGADVHLAGPVNEHVAYLVFVRATPTAKWQRIDINRACLPLNGKGHDMGHHGLQQASQVLIRNLAATPLCLDTVSAIYHEAVAAEPARHHH